MIRKVFEIRDDEGRRAIARQDDKTKEYLVQFYDHKGVWMDASDVLTKSREEAFAAAGLVELSPS